MTDVSEATKKWLKRAGGNTDPATALFFKATPPVHSVVRYASHRVLLSGCPTHLPFLQGNMPPIAKEHGLEVYTIDHHTEMGYRFWAKFFGTADILGARATRTVPSLIITSGWMRHHDNSGRGFSMNGTEKRIREIAAEWNVPVVHLPVL